MTGEDDRPAEAVPGTFRIAAELLGRFARPEVPAVAFGLGLVLAQSGLAILQPWPLKLVIDSVIGGHAVPGPLRAVADSLASITGLGDQPRLALLITLVLGILGLQLTVSAVNVASHYVLVASGLRMVSRLRCRVFDHIQHLSLRFHDTTTVGDSLYRVTWDTYCVQSLLNGGLVPCITQTVTLAGIAAMMVTRDWIAAVAALAVAIPLMLLIRRLDRPMTERSLTVQERESAISTRVQEALSGIRAVKAFGREDFEAARFKSHADASLLANLRLTVLQAGSQGVVGLLLAAGTAAIVFLGAWRCLDGRMTPGDLVLLVAYVAMIHGPLETLTYAAVEIQKSAAGARRIIDLLDAVPDVGDQPAAVDLTQRAAGHLVIDGLAFEYRPGERVLDDLRLEIPAGTTVALVGPSGAGKTTLVSLVLRFYDPTAGRILLDGRDLRAISLASLRRSMAIVLQDPVLFSASIRENIAYGRPGATEAEIVAAARAAAAHDFIAALPRGYDTPIGERGVSLSGGQRQRLSIARAFLKDAPLLILDEPTSALDAETERLLMQATRELVKGRTTLIIAHRLSTVRDAQLIVAMSGGRIVETGTHAELLARGGLYAHLYQEQMKAPAAAPAGDPP